MADVNFVGVFPGRDSESARTALRRAWMQISKVAGIYTEKKVLGRKHLLTRYVPKYTIHHLRHSFASQLVSHGASLEQVGQYLGHKQVSTTRRYGKVDMAAKRQLANTFADLLSNGRKQPHA